MTHVATALIIAMGEINSGAGTPSHESAIDRLGLIAAWAAAVAVAVLAAAVLIWLRLSAHR